MARTRNPRPDDDLDFGEAAHVPSTAIEQPPALAVPDITDNPMALLASTLGLKPEQLTNLADANEKIRLISVTAEARQHAQQIRSEEESILVRAQTGLTARARSQAIVDAHWGNDPTATRYQVWHAKNPDTDGMPEAFPLEIPARSPEEAQGRYLKTCGIQNTGHMIRVLPLEEYRKRRREREAMRDMVDDRERDRDDNGGFPSAN